MDQGSGSRTWPLSAWPAFRFFRLRQTWERKLQSFRAFGSELSVGRRLLLELCSNLWIVLLSSQALKGERVLQILFEQFHG